jgi:hypothetical protein
MLTFAEYCRKGEAFACSLRDRDDWLVSDVSRHRESDHCDQSNFDETMKILGGESDTVEIVGFGHWAVGRVEHIFVHPSRAEEVKAIEDRLADHPILNEDDFSERESNAGYQAWCEFGCRDFAQAMQEEFDLMDSTRDLLEKSPDDTLYVFEHNEPYAVHTESDRVRVRACGGQTKITRDQMANMLRKLRTGIRQENTK